MEHQQQQRKQRGGGGGAVGASQSAEAPSRRALGPTTLHFVLRTEHEAQLYALQAPPSSAGSTGPSAPEIAKDDRLRLEGPHVVEFSADGRLGAVAHGKGVAVADCGEGWAVRHNLPETDVAALSFSPRGSFLLTLARLPSARVGQPTPVPEKGNLCVWDTRSGHLLAHFLHKKSALDAWPVIRWSEDEEIAAKMVTNEIQFFFGSNFDQVTKRIRLEGVSNFAFAPGTLPPVVAAFVPEKKGGPGQASIYKYPAVDQPVATKTLWKAQTAELEWGPNASGLLVAAKTDVDKSGKSYYGSTTLHFVSPRAAPDAALALDEDGPVHEWSWSPDGSKFVVIYGYMPARATLFDAKCNKLAEFGKAARNTARWSPCSRLLALGGFGNLNGQIDIWDVSKVLKVGSCQASCASSLDWSPDSAYLLAAVLSPKIRVDNGVTVFRYNGSVVGHLAVEKLYQAAWRPGRLEDFALVRIRPAKTAAAASSSGGSPGLGSRGGAAAPAGGKPAIYQPPSRRGMGAGPVNALREEDEESEKPKKYTAPGQGGNKEARKKAAPELPVGFIAESKTAKRNKQRRQRKKNTGEEESEASQQQQQQQDETQGAVTAEDAAKKAKAIEKKLRQIAGLREKQAAGATLDADQLQKVAAEADLRDQLQKLKL